MIRRYSTEDAISMLQDAKTNRKAASLEEEGERKSVLQQIKDFEKMSEEDQIEKAHSMVAVPLARA